MLVGARVSILFVLSCYMKYGGAGREVPFKVITPNVSGFNEELYKVV
jgi:hypothetical protein